ncbi:probable basic-leucine zipper transcription factor E isoform X1 [Olea europaea var. sylvestris]|uniref:Uncharacterized protein n=1 Tax=Olea europaea subsp. europaea TaxID=158383 RepID=A0A8S0UES7_OLEEU|nr:probable basic-leucine zipper transcription factor E isoform X1 [Olea europaea var. sylvestris]CAA3015617.1 Hypothetical predicted protein [Olea europaea subsp. europaea]
MEGVGARLGRSSTRYGPTTVFTGPVRKWKKKWVHASAFNSNNHDHQTPNGNANGSSHLLFYKWTVITPSQNKDNNGGDSNNGNNNVSSNGDSKNSDKVDSFAVEEPPKRKFKYIPIAVLEEQKNELSEQVEDEAKPIEFDANAEEVTSKSDRFDEKPDINDVPTDENKSTDNSPEERQDLNESTTFGLNENNGDNESDSKTDQSERQPQPV